MLTRLSIAFGRPKYVTETTRSVYDRSVQFHAGHRERLASQWSMRLTDFAPALVFDTLTLQTLRRGQAIDPAVL